MKLYTKIYLIVFLLSLLIEVITTPLRGCVGMAACSVVTFVLYFIFINYVLKKYVTVKPIYVLLITLIGCSVIPLPFHIFDFKRTLGVLPDYLFHLFGILMGYWFYKSNKTLRIVILAIALISNAFIYFKGYEMWDNKLNFDTFTGKVEKQSINFEFQTSENDTVQLTDFKGTYLVLDCWYTYCGYCYKAFPQVQKLYDKYKDNTEITICAVHSRIEEAKGNKAAENTGTGIDILKEENYTFPCFSVDIKNPVLKELGVNVYPTVLVFDKESNLIFRGDIENVEKFASKLVKEK